MLTIAVFNFKGGTGKSTTALNLSVALARAKLKTLVVDLDGQRTLSFGMGHDGDAPTSLEWLHGEKITVIEIEKNLSLLPGHLGLFKVLTDKDLIGKALKQLKVLDLNTCLMDCPPSLGVVPVQAILNSDRILLPTLCEPAALKGLSEAIALIREESPNKPIDVLRTRYKPRLVLTREADELLQASAGEFGYTLLSTVIPENIPVAEAIAQQQSVIDYSKNSTGSKAYKALAKEVIKLWGVKG